MYGSGIIRFSKSIVIERPTSLEEAVGIFGEHVRQWQDRAPFTVRFFASGQKELRDQWLDFVAST